MSAATKWFDDLEQVMEQTEAELQREKEYLKALTEWEMSDEYVEGTVY